MRSRIDVLDARVERPDWDTDRVARVEETDVVGSTLMTTNNEPRVLVWNHHGGNRGVSVANDTCMLHPGLNALPLERADKFRNEFASARKDIEVLGSDVAAIEPDVMEAAVRDCTQKHPTFRMDQQIAVLRWLQEQPVSHLVAKAIKEVLADIDPTAR